MTNHAPTDPRHFETYKGRDITVVYRPHFQSGYSSRGAGFDVYVDGKTYQDGSFPTERFDRSFGDYIPVDTPEEALIAKAVKKGRQWIDADITDAEIRPSLETDIHYLPRAVKAHLTGTGTAPTDFEVGDLVWFHSRGNLRQGRVEKIGKTNIGVAYVTEVGGIITRKSLKPAEVGSGVEGSGKHEV